VATRTLTLRNVPTAIVDAIVDFALDEDRTPAAQAERLLREALTQHGRWPHVGPPASTQCPGLISSSPDPRSAA